ncbi:phage tail spike protein [Gracilibacillus sp. D59]|uniref:phage tail spike protein n=1 Tax=Gracilibacillus sp. D59 TaxID=3457434 RepID=UPI003FCECF90
MGFEKTPIYIFDKQDNLLTITDNYIEAPFEEKTEKPVALTVTFPAEDEDAQHLVGGNQVAFKDLQGRFRLFVVREEDDEHTDTAERTVKCLPCIQELDDVLIEDRRLTDATMAEVLDAILEKSRWKRGNVADLGIQSMNFYYVFGYASLQKASKQFTGEFIDRIEVDSTGIAGRYVDIVASKGVNNGKRFEIGKDIRSIRRTKLFYPKTALYGRGSSVKSGDGYSRKITFADVEWSTANGDPVNKPLGQEWVGDDQARQDSGIWNDELQQMEHRFGHVEFNDETDKEALLQSTYQELQNKKKVQAEYEMSIATYYKIAGKEHEQVFVGDTGIARDMKIKPIIVIESRVLKLTYDIGDPSTGDVTLGNFLELDDREQDIEWAVEKVKNNAGAWDSSSTTTDESFPDTVPSTPTGLTAKGAFETIQLRWDYDASSYIAGYELYASQTAGFIPDDATNLVWRGKSGGYVFDANTNEQWYFKLRVFNTHGTRSDLSAEVTAQTLQINGSTDIAAETITRFLLAKEAMIEKVHLNEAIITDAHVDGRLSAGKIVVGSNTSYEPNYDPSTKETPTGAQNKANTAESNAKTYTDNQLTNYVEATVYDQDISDLQAQIDNQITSHFYNHEPTLDNEPAVNWTTTKEKDNHIGDLFYDASTGYSYRFMIEDTTYKWTLVRDEGISKALQDAEQAQDTADSKRRVFIAQPTTPYDEGDLWDKNGAVYRSTATKTSSATFASSDWVKIGDVTSEHTAKDTANVNGNPSSNMETKSGAQSKADSAEQSAKKYVDISDYGNVKTFNNPVTESSGGQTAGVVVIHTPITLNNYMTRVNISGYMYGNNTDVDLSVGFYAYSSGNFPRKSFVSKGDYKVSKVRLATDSSGKVVVILGDTTSSWNYPKLAIDKAQIGHTTPPDSFRTGWSITFETDISAYTNVLSVPARQLETEDGAQSKANSAESNAKGYTDQKVYHYPNNTFVEGDDASVYNPKPSVAVMQVTSGWNGATGSSYGVVTTYWSDAKRARQEYVDNNNKVVVREVHPAIYPVWSNWREVEDTAGAQAKADQALKDAKDYRDLWAYPGTTKINGGNIYTNSVTANEINVSRLSALSADLGDITAGNINTDNVVIGNNTVTIDNQGIEILDGNFIIKDSLTNTISTAMFKNNLVADHSFESVVAGSSTTGDYVFTAHFPSQDNMYTGWSGIGSPRVQTIYETDGDKLWIMFGLKQLLVNNGNYGRQRVAVKPNTTLNMSAHFRRHPAYTAGAPRLAVVFYDSAYSQITSYAQSFTAPSTDHLTYRYDITFTTPSNCAYVELRPYTNGSNWLLVDGVQLVEHDMATPYAPENELSNIMHGLTRPENLYASIIEGESVSSLGDVWTSNNGNFRSNGGYVVLRGQDRVYIQTSGDVRITAEADPNTLRTVTAGDANLEHVTANGGLESGASITVDAGKLDESRLATGSGNFYLQTSGDAFRFVEWFSASNYLPVRASDFITASTVTGKTNIKDFNTALEATATDIIMDQNFHTYHRQSDIDKGIYDKKRVGLLSEESHYLFRDEKGINNYSLASTLGVMNQEQELKIRKHDKEFNNVYEILDQLAYDISQLKGA